MNEDLEIKQLLMNVGKDLSDGSGFMEELNSKLEAVEDIKSYHDCQIRKSRTIAVAAFVIGGILGALLCAIFLLKPVSSSQLALLLDSRVYVLFMSYKLYFLICLGLITILAGLFQIKKFERDSA